MTKLHVSKNCQDLSFMTCISDVTLVDYTIRRLKQESEPHLGWNWVCKSLKGRITLA